jgi:hypothetical protein
MREEAPEQPDHERSVIEPDTDPAPELASAAPERAPAFLASARAWLLRRSWMILAAAAALVLTQVVEFSPPEDVRIDDATVDFVGEAPRQEFSEALGNPQAVQLRGTLRLYPRGEFDVREVDPEIDDKARVLSQPVVTTIYAMNATIDQSVRLDGGRLEIDIAFAGTPRLGEAGKNKVPELTLEHELTVSSREKKWMRDPVQRVHLHTRGTLTDLEDRPYRWVFVIEGKQFALDLELNRAA